MFHVKHTTLFIVVSRIGQTECVKEFLNIEMSTHENNPSVIRVRDNCYTKNTSPYSSCVGHIAEREDKLWRKKEYSHARTK